MYSIEIFLNNLIAITKDLIIWNIDKVYRKDVDKDYSYLKFWDTGVLKDICPKECICTCTNNEDAIDCKKLDINYYIKYSIVGEECHGIMIFNLKDYYVQMSYVKQLNK